MRIQTNTIHQFHHLNKSKKIKLFRGKLVSKSQKLLRSRERGSQPIKMLANPRESKYSFRLGFCPPLEQLQSQKPKILRKGISLNNMFLKNLNFASKGFYLKKGFVPRKGKVTKKRNNFFKQPFRIKSPPHNHMFMTSTSPHIRTKASNRRTRNRREIKNLNLKSRQGDEKKGDTFGTETPARQVNNEIYCSWTQNKQKNETKNL